MRQIGKGFFSRSDTALPKNKAVGRLPRCAACGLHKTCQSPRMEAHGDGGQKILILAEAPGANEDKRGEQFVGKAGHFLREYLHHILGMHLEKDCWKLNAINCRPQNNRKPSMLEVDCCRPFVLSQIRKLKPRLILLFGTAAVQSLIGYKWKRDLGTIGKWRGHNIPDQDINAWLCPTYHPSYLMRETAPPAASRVWSDDLKNAATYLDKDIPPLPTEKNVKILSTEDACSYLKGLNKQKKVIAFDYETTGLKPYKEGHRIVSCAICDSPKMSYAFLLDDKIKPFLVAILKNKNIGKIAANMKFEDLWSRVCLGTGVEGWLFDTMIATHIIDNRPGVTSLKFQVYVRYGLADYEQDVHGLLKSKGKSAHAFNHIDDIPVNRLLYYNGMDALLERRLGEDLRKELIC